MERRKPRQVWERDTHIPLISGTPPFGRFGPTGLCGATVWTAFLQKQRANILLAAWSTDAKLSLYLGRWCGWLTAIFRWSEWRKRVQIGHLQQLGSGSDQSTLFRSSQTWPQLGQFGVVRQSSCRGTWILKLWSISQWPARTCRHAISLVEEFPVATVPTGQAVVQQKQTSGTLFSGEILDALQGSSYQLRRDPLKKKIVIVIIYSFRGRFGSLQMKSRTSLSHVTHVFVVIGWECALLGKRSARIYSSCRFPFCHVQKLGMAYSNSPLGSFEPDKGNRATRSMEWCL